MGIAHYIKEIGRGKEGARALNRAQAADMLGQILDGIVSDLEVGAFCLAMRIKGETPLEMAGFLDAIRERMQLLPIGHIGHQPVVVLPSYNGARKLPLLTPLLGALLAKRGLAVLINGAVTEDKRVPVTAVLAELGMATLGSIRAIQPGECVFAPTELLCPGLHRLLEVRRLVGLRNPAHSLVKLMNPCAGPALIISSYTHPEYAVQMRATIALMGSSGLLLRGTEGEVVADARRMPLMEGFVHGQCVLTHAAQSGTLGVVPELPGIDASATAAYIRDVLDGRLPVPAPIAQQVGLISQLGNQLEAQP